MTGRMRQHMPKDTQQTAADREHDDELLRQWAAEVVAALEVEGLEVDLKAVLGLAGRAAHAVLRPAAPLTTFIAGFAAGRAAASGVDTHTAVAQALSTATRLCREHAQAPAAG